MSCQIDDDEGNANAPAFTAQENAVYDRQLRVWGVEVQKRLQKAKVLLVGDNCLLSEVGKNVVLAGVGSVCVFAGSFFFNGEHGSHFLANCHPELSSAASCVKVLQEMNPLVDVKPLEATTLDAAAVQPFDVVCLTGGSLVEQASMNALCRTAHVKFCCARCTGPFGWMFFDLMKYNYTSDDKESPEPRRMRFNQLDEALSADIANLPRKLHGLYLVLRVCMEFEREQARPPVHLDAEEILSKAMGRFSERVLDGQLLRFYLDNAPEFPPVCSVLGGMLANELVKIVSLKGDPVQNFLFYDITDGKGILHFIE